MGSDSRRVSVLVWALILDLTCRVGVRQGNGCLLFSPWFSPFCRLLWPPALTYRCVAGLSPSTRPLPMHSTRLCPPVCLPTCPSAAPCPRRFSSLPPCKQDNLLVSTDVYECIEPYHQRTVSRHVCLTVDSFVCALSLRIHLLLVRLPPAPPRTPPALRRPTLLFHAKTLRCLEVSPWSKRTRYSGMWMWRDAWIQVARICCNAYGVLTAYMSVCAL